MARLAPRWQIDHARIGSGRLVSSSSSQPERYAIWGRHQDTWRRLGALDLRDDGDALTVLDRLDTTMPLEELQISKESSAGTITRGEAVVAWPSRGH